MCYWQLSLVSSISLDTLDVRCQHEGLHLDLRELNTVKLIKTRRSQSGLAAVLGTGSTWGRVLDFIPPTKYSMVHGQCLNVGVGGYLLGGGVNALGASARFGWGAENVIMMKAVLADGRQARLTEERVEIYGGGGEVERRSYTPDTDLWFALRGAGSSFAIVTEFVVNVFPRPETLPIIIPISIDSVQDFANIEVISTNVSRTSN